MGCTLPCCDDYTELKDPAIEFEEKSFLVDVPSTKNALFDLDPNSLIFKGTTVTQKFSSKATYDQKIFWINIDSRTLNLSENYAKEGLKEAKIKDIVNIVAGPPDKYKPVVYDNGKTESLGIGRCLSIMFNQGDGIDLRFATESERDDCYVVLTKLIYNPDIQTASEE